MTVVTRPPDAKRIHFSCNGSISLLDDLPSSMLRIGDTATAPRWRIVTRSQGDNP